MAVGKKETRKRLNSTIFATNYSTNHTIDVSGKKENFTFNEIITLDVTKPTKSYTANGKNIVITKAYLVINKNKNLISLKNIKYDKNKETIKFKFDKPLPKGIAYLELDCIGHYGDVSGLYLSKYSGRDGKNEYMATTQFEASDARMAFVCEDEPEAKATYDIALTLDKKLKAISNMPEKETIHLSDAMKTVVFQRTPKMSSYLVYLGVADFETSETKAGNTTLRVVTLPGKIEQAGFALKAGKELLLKKEKYYGIPYPLPKLDMIAVPDFSAGAMENWGAITFREDRLLSNPKTAPSQEKIATISTISHELEHMWFGNLVTMAWWDDLWLNESFADVRAYNGLEESYPELDPWAEFLSKRVAGAYIIDGLKNSHPVHVNVNSPSEIREIFDAISYSKGGMILRMIEHLLGKDTYRKGLQIYLKKHAYSNTHAKDLWTSLQEASGKPVGKIVDAWINTIGLPIVDAELNNNKIKVSQRRFNYLGSDRKTIWNIPLLIITDNKKLKNEMLEGKSKIVTLPEKNHWIKLNGGEFGFYRVRYSKELLNGIKKAVCKKNISVIDRWGIHNDLAALCFAGEISLKEYLDFVTESYINEDAYLVLMDIFSALQKMMIISTDEKFFDILQKRIHLFYSHLLSRIGFAPRKGEKETQGTIRAALFSGLGRLNDKVILKNAKEFAEKEFAAPGSISPDIRGVSYKLTAWQGDEKTFEKMLEIYMKAKNPSERNNLIEAKEALEALGSFKDEKILDKSFKFVLSSEVKPSDVAFFAISVLANPYGRKKLWPLMKKNWKLIKEYYDGGLTSHFNRILLGLSTLADTKVGNEIRKFIGKHNVHGTERSVKQMHEMMEINERFLQRAKKEF